MALNSVPQNSAAGDFLKQAILLAAYGAGGIQGMSALRFFESMVRQAFPCASVRWAFTSALSRRRLANIRRKSDSVQKALCRLGFERYDQVVVQSLHLIPGSEHEGLLAEARAVSGGAPPDIRVGGPLLRGDGDVEEAARVMLAHAPEERLAEEAVIWVGHGTGHKGKTAYASLGEAVSALDPHTFVGVLSGTPDLPHILERLRGQGINRAWLMPLFSVLGKHAVEDVSGEGGSAWAAVLRRNGIICRSVLRGLGDYEGFAALWLHRLQEAARQERTPV
jgi:sirohydrochlorin cobaltochelatase